MLGVGGDGDLVLLHCTLFHVSTNLQPSYSTPWSCMLASNLEPGELVKEYDTCENNCVQEKHSDHEKHHVIVS